MRACSTAPSLGLRPPYGLPSWLWLPPRARRLQRASTPRIRIVEGSIAVPYRSAVIEAHPALLASMHSRYPLTRRHVAMILRLVAPAWRLAASQIFKAILP